MANIIEDGRWGGPQSRIVRVAEKLEKTGVCTHIIYPTIDSDTLGREIRKRGLSHSRTYISRPSRPDKPLRLISYIISFVGDILRICKSLVNNNVDVVHCNSPVQVKGLIAARLTGIPTIWHLNDTDSSRIMVSAVRLLQVFLADGFIVSCERTRRQYLPKKSYSNKPIGVAYPPVDTNLFDPKEHSVRKEFDNDSLTVTTVARINPKKGISIFIDMSRIAQQNIDRDVTFKVVGPVPDTKTKFGNGIIEYAKSSGAPSLQFTGEILDIPSVLKGTDVFVCSSHAESGPMTVFEAMSMRVPVVSTDVGDVRRLLERKNERAGYVVEKGDSEALADRVRELLLDRRLKEKLGDNARRIATTHLDTKIAARNHKNIYKRVANHDGARGS